MRLTFTGCEPRSIPAETGLPPLTGFEAFIPPPRVLELSAAGRGGPAPLYLQDPASPFRAVPLPEQDAVYVQFRANADFAGRHDAAAFVRQAEADLRAARPRFVILDERFNFGGDLNITRGFIQALPEIVGPDGRVFVLTSGRTFSAGIASAAYARQAGGPQTILIGATPGDKLEFWAEGDLVTLPRSGATFMYATERHNYMTGCPEADCHGSIQQHPIRIESLDPDSPVPFTYADFKAGRDPLLEKALALIDQMR